jgi:hypothetical protein
LRELRRAFDRDLAIDALASLVGAFVLGWLGSAGIFLGAFLGAMLSRVVRVVVRRWSTRTVWGVGGAFGILDVSRLLRGLLQPGSAVTSGGPAAAVGSAGIPSQVVGIVIAAAVAGGAAAVARPMVTQSPQAPGGLQRELQGHWRGDWGDHYFRVNGTTFRAAFEDGPDGRIVGTIDGNRLHGWWTEAPDRKPLYNAGEVEFRLVKTRGGLTLDGTWRYGSGQPRRRNWDLTRVGSAMPPSLAGTFGDTASFVAYP